MTDLEIESEFKPKKIVKIAKKIGISKKDLILYGDYKAKINKLPKHQYGKLILVTAINPTSSGIGKTTVSIGLADAFTLKKRKVCLALREPSLGPVFGIKGGATGGGKSQITPSIDINLHFNGDFHAITSANNLLSAIIDNHIFQGNALQIDSKHIFFNRCLDVNDRALRDVVVSQSNNATPREEHFVITAASEIMAIMCLAEDMDDLKNRLGNIMVGLNFSGKPIYARDLKAENAMAILLKDALKPNLVQTLGGTPAIVHCGPFANIAHGCNSIIATQTALSVADYAVTEAGFGADLGAEKFFDVKCRQFGLKPSCVVLVVTINALKLHGGVDKAELSKPNLSAVQKGISNLLSHINTIKNVYKLPLVVTLNKFTTDTPEEINYVEQCVKEQNCEFALNNVWGEGGKGALELESKVEKLCKTASDFQFAYDLDAPVKTKIKDLANKVYGTNKIKYTDKALESLKTISKLKLSHLPIVVAKTQYSLSDNQKLLGAPKDFEITVQDIEIRTGAKFLVVILGAMLLMPGLSKTPAAINMNIDNEEHIKGIF